MEFPVWFISQMKEISYKELGGSKADNYISLTFKDDMEHRFVAIYIHREMSPQAIKAAFEVYECPVLFVVDLDLTVDLKINVSLGKEVSLWLRALHAIYYGRIYTWNGRNIRALHIDKSKNDFAFSEPIDITGILFDHTDCKLRDFLGNFYIARFYDAAFWKQQSKPPKQETWKERAKKQREEWEQATKSHSEKDYKKQQYQEDSETSHKRRHTDEDIYEAFKRAFAEHMRNYNVDWDAYNHVNKRSAPVGDKWLSILIETGSLEAARRKFKELAKQYHPDLNPGDATALVTMQEISNAFDKVKEYWK